MSAFQPTLHNHKLVSEACVQVTGRHKLIVVCGQLTVYELQAFNGGVDCSVQRGMLEATPSVVQG